MKNINLLFILTIYFFLSGHALSKSLIIENNKRLSFDDINNITPFDLNSSELTDSDINKIIKDLLSSDLISNLTLNIDSDNYFLNIDEAIFINQIFINGNIKLKNSDITQNIRIKDKSFITQKLIESNTQIIENLYYSIGQQNVLVSFYLEELADSSYNLIYEVSENFEKYINDINVEGNSFISSKFIKSILSIKEKQFFTLLSNSNFITKYKVTDNTNKITNLYKDAGFFDVNVNFNINEFNNKISLSIFIEEGERYLVQNVNYIFENDGVNSLLLDDIDEFHEATINSFYSSEYVDLFLNKLNDKLYINNYPNLKIDYSYSLDNNSLTLDFSISETQPLIVKKINFFGNQVTKDSTLRRQIYIKPGDLYNKRLTKKSTDTLIRKPYIDNVTINTNNYEDNSVDLDFILSEKLQSGSFKIGAGYSAQSGISSSIGLSDSNFLGSGNKASIDITASDKSVLFDATYNKFYLGSYLIDNKYRIYNNQDNLKTTYGYNRDSYGLEFSLKLPQTYDIFKDVYYRMGIGYEGSNTYDLTSTVSTSVTQNSGKSNNIVITTAYINDTTNQNFNPTLGSRHSILFNLSPSSISDDDYVKITTNNNYYFKRKNTNNSYFILSSLGLASGLSNKIKTKDSFILGGNFKGFQYSGIGPRDSSLNYLGGTKMYQLTIGYSSPVLFDNKDTLIIKYFATIGSIFDSEYASSFNPKSPNSSIGASLDVMTAVGPLSISLASPISKKSYDKTQTFDFSIGTSF